MRCEQVTRALAIGGNGLDPAALAGHLAACPSCASWAEASERLDANWQATRPAEPSEADFEALWGRVLQTVESEPQPVPEDAPATLPFEASPGRRRWALIAMTVAQAAALLIGAVGLLHWGSPSVQAAPMVVEVEEGQNTFIRIGGDGIEVVRDDPVVASDTNTVDVGIDLLNVMETIE